jgi:hypothetical protein
VSTGDGVLSIKRACFDGEPEADACSLLIPVGAVLSRERERERERALLLSALSL